MGLSLATIRSEVLNELGIEATDLDAAGTTNLDLMINQSWWEVMDKFDFKEKEDTTTFLTVAGTRDYDLAAKITVAASVTFDALRSVFIVNPDSLAHSELVEIGLAQYEGSYNEDTDSRDIPTNYFRHGGIIRVWPTPDDAYTLTVYFLKVLSDIPSNGPVIPQSWHEIIKYGAIWRGHHRFRDYNSARDVKMTQMDLIASAQTNSGKEDKLGKKLLGVEVPSRDVARRY